MLAVRYILIVLATTFAAAQLRSAPRRSGLVSGFCLLHSFQAATPFSFRILTCSSFAIRPLHPQTSADYSASTAEAGLQCGSKGRGFGDLRPIFFSSANLTSL